MATHEAQKTNEAAELSKQKLECSVKKEFLLEQFLSCGDRERGIDIYQALCVL
jgi:hypothetical protein